MIKRALVEKNIEKWQVARRPLLKDEIPAERLAWTKNTRIRIKRNENQWFTVMNALQRSP
jgi:hypothetical protein